MRKITVIFLVLIGQQCFSQTAYDDTLALRLKQIKKLKFYSTDAVIKIDSVDYGDASFPYWKQNDTYYQYDLARYRNCSYQALLDGTKGQRPDTSRTAWTLIDGPHPYLFLRDTARLEDLDKLMLDEHVYIRTYTLGALSFRNSDKLFSLITDNLRDTTQITVSGCAYMNAYPADLMILYAEQKLTGKEKRKLIGLINAKYKYLSLGLKILKNKINFL